MTTTSLTLELDCSALTQVQPLDAPLQARAHVHRRQLQRELKIGTISVPVCDVSPHQSVHQNMPQQPELAFFASL